jgi:hypothetical protein
MAFENRTECAVPECKDRCLEGANLCERHRVGGVVIENDAGSGVVTIWFAEHDNQCGLILLNDWALGSHFGGAAGFEARLKQQGFTKVRNVTTPEQLEVDRLRAGKAIGNWSGPWSTKYPWESEQE